MERRENHRDTSALAPTRVQTKTVTVAADELETVLDKKASEVAALEEINAYLRKMGELGDDSTCLGDMLDPGAVVLAPPVVEEPRTVHAYCEPALPFLPVEDLVAPVEVDGDPFEDDLAARGETAAASRQAERLRGESLAPFPRTPLEEKFELPASDPIVEYLREVSDDFAHPAEKTQMRPSGRHVVLSLPAQDTPVAPRPLVVEPTEPEQAAVPTACFRRPRWAQPGVVSSAQVPSFSKRPLWLAALMGATIAALLLTSSAFTVEVMASKRIPAVIEKVVDIPIPTAVPR